MCVCVCVCVCVVRRQRFSMEYVFVKGKGVRLCETQRSQKRRFYIYCTQRWTLHVHIIPTIRWTWLISSSLKSRYNLVTKTQIITDTFLLITVDYLLSPTYRMLGEIDNETLLNGSIHYTLTTRGSKKIRFLFYCHQITSHSEMRLYSLTLVNKILSHERFIVFLT
jgi:hypothetical protein